jgi:polyferredoxin
VGGLLAVVVSAVLLLSVVFRGLVNPLNLWTIVLGAIAGSLALQRRPTRLALLVAVIVLAGAALPALIGGVGWLYLPSMVLLIAEIVSPARGKASRGIA